MSDAKRTILARRARFLTAALAGLGCSPSAKPVETGTARELTIPRLAADGGVAPAPSFQPASDGDRDHDGVLDPDDACPDVPGPPNMDLAHNGCPTNIAMACLSIVVPPKITFPLNGSTPLDTALIDTVADTMKRNPQVNVEVEGHTEPGESNSIGQKRAEAVRWELIKRGVSQGRLTTSNAGSTKPIAPNATDAGRAKNRRVELIVH